MVLGILTSLASFSTKRPKTILIIAATVAILAFGVHYKLLVGERDKLRVAEEGYKRAVTAFVQREETLQEDIRNEREAAATAVAERNAARRSVEVFRAGRESDPESLQWASQPMPVGEVERLCVALPEMDGCQDTAPNN